MRHGPMTPLRILLVEDDATIGMLLTEMLEDLGHRICGTATTEVEAAAAAALHAPDLMLVDVQLVSGNGLSAMRMILRSRAVPHIFMTGGHFHAMPPDATVLRKPFSERDLISALDHALGAPRAL